MTTIDRLTTALADRYRIERELGAGGMATVYLARDLKHDRDVAIKVLHPDLGAALGGERFLAEIRTTARLQHPHILPLLDSGDAGGGLLYYVMPLATGETLRDRLTREKQLPIGEAVKVATEVADALGYAHQHGIIHRDIKPENILLQGGHALVADFGIALAVQQAGGSRMTQTGLSLGTPQYMSPEQAMGERTIDARSDIYALGAVSYEMLVGDPPFTGSTVQAIVAKVLTERPTQPTAVRDTIPGHVEATVLKALAKLPADRFSSASDFAHALQHAGDTAALTSAHTAAGGGPRAAAPARRVVGLLAATTLLSTAAAVWGWMRPEPPARTSILALSLPDSQRVLALNASIRMALSCDGSQLAYVGMWNNRTAIFIRALDDTIPRRIRGTEGAGNVIWSPAGTELLFGSVGVAGMFSINPMGGTAVPLSERAIPTDWGLDGSILFMRSNAIWRRSRAGEPALVAQPDSTGPETYSGARFLPGDQAAVFTIGPRGGGLYRTEVAVVTLKDGAVKRLGIEGRALGYANGFLLVGQTGAIVAYPFSPSGRAVTGPPVPLFERVQQGPQGASAAVSDEGTIVFGSGESGSRTILTVVDRAGKARPLLAESKLFSWPRVSPDGRRVAVEVGGETGGYDVWVLDVPSRALSRLTSNSRGIRPFGWSQDGRQVGYLATQAGAQLGGGDRDVAWVPWDLSGPPRILHVDSKDRVEDATVSPAGDLIAIRVLGYGAPGDLLVAPVDSPRVAAPLVATTADEETPRFSTDGRFLAYASNETGAFEVYVRALSGTGGRLQVSAGGGSEPAWARDGSGLFYRGSTHMMFAALNARAEVVRRDTLFADVYRKENRAVAYDVFPNGQEFLMQRFANEGRGDLSVVLNWPELARRRAAATR